MIHVIVCDCVLYGGEILFCWRLSRFYLGPSTPLEEGEGSSSESVSSGVDPSWNYSPSNRPRLYDWAANHWTFISWSFLYRTLAPLALSLLHFMGGFIVKYGCRIQMQVAFGVDLGAWVGNVRRRMMQQSARAMSQLNQAPDHSKQATETCVFNRGISHTISSRPSSPNTQSAQPNHSNEVKNKVLN